MGPIRRRSGWRALSVLNVPGAALAEKSASAREAHLTSAVPSGPSEATGEAGGAGSGREAAPPGGASGFKPLNGGPRAGGAISSLEAAPPPGGGAVHVLEERPPPPGQAP